MFCKGLASGEADVSSRIGGGYRREASVAPMNFLEKSEKIIAYSNRFVELVSELENAEPSV